MKIGLPGKARRVRVVREPERAPEPIELPERETVEEPEPVKVGARAGETVEGYLKRAVDVAAYEWEMSFRNNIG